MGRKPGHGYRAGSRCAEQSVRLLGSRYLAAGRIEEEEVGRRVDSFGRFGEGGGRRWELEYWLPKLGNTEETSCVVYR